MHRSRGFTLTELLVALAIGALIALGAGQLFLSSINTFQRVDRLGHQQEALVFIATTVADTFRRVGVRDAEGNPHYRLICTGPSKRCRCTVQDQRAAQPLVTFDRPGEGACSHNEALGEAQTDAAIQVSLPLGPGGEEVAFHVTPRQHVLDGDVSR